MSKQKCMFCGERDIEDPMNGMSCMSTKDCLSRYLILTILKAADAHARINRENTYNVFKCACNEMHISTRIVFKSPLEEPFHCKQCGEQKVWSGCINNL